MKRYDVIIVGAGPAGIFCAYELINKNSKLKILILDKGKDIDNRICPIRSNKSTCKECRPCSLLCGWGGSGAFSDGKLTISPNVGGNLESYIGREELIKQINKVDKIYLKFGAPKELHKLEGDGFEEIQKKAILADLQLISAPIRHLGTDLSINVLRSLRDYLKPKIEIKMSTEVSEFISKNGIIIGVRTKKGEEIKAKYVITAPGREGSKWFVKQAELLGLQTSVNPVDIGVRVEVPAAVTEELTSKLYEPKLIYYSKFFNDKIRTFCVNPYGEVVTEYNDGLITVNGHSYAKKKTNNTNFALLVSKNFTDPFKEPITYGQHIARLANMLGGGVIVQRLGDLIMGRRSTSERISKNILEPTLKSATPGDLSLVLPHRYMTGILEMLKALDQIAPGINSRNTLLYGVEVKFYSTRLKLNNSLETQIKNLFACGDGVGVSRGLIQASVSGVIVAKEILNQI